MTYHHPLAYLLAMQGVALLDAWSGGGDRAFVEARIAETRRLLADPELVAHAGVEVGHDATAEAYEEWAASYDDPSNGLFELDEPVITDILASIPAGRALDAACGTGRLTRLLLDHGDDVIGVDGSDAMLEVARLRLPAVTWRTGSLRDLDLPDDSVDHLVCGLALVHVADLAAVYAEFARVVRPGGHVIISDVHHDLAWLGSAVAVLGPDGEPRQAETHAHPVTDHLRAALAAGLQVRRCEEQPNAIPRELTGRVTPSAEAEAQELGSWRQWPWTLINWAPEASRVAWSRPALVVWHFQA